MRALSTLYSRQRYAARPSLLCHSPLALLQDAALARIAGEKRVHCFFIIAAQNSDMDRVRDIVIADPTVVHDTCYYEEDRYCEGLELNEGLDTAECDARHFHTRT